jgi:hypothetical protein
MAVAEQIPYPKLKKRLARKQSPHVEAGGSLAEIVAPLASAGRLSQRAMMAAHRFLQDLQADAGTSGNIAALYGERVQSSRKPSTHPAGWAQAGDRVQAIIDQLSGYEREVLDFLVRNREYQRRGLADWGKMRAQYTNADTASGFAVGQCAMLLEKIADLYSKYAIPKRV